MTRRPVERVQRHAAIDPAGRVAGVEGVGKRRQKVLRDAGGVAHELQHLAADLVRKFGGRKTANQCLGEVAGLEPFKIAPHFVDEPEPDLVRGHLVVQDPLLPFRDRNRLGQQVVHLDHLDAAVSHLGDEIEVIALGVLDPKNVVEQQVVAVARREPLVRAARRADHHQA